MASGPQHSKDLLANVDLHLNQFYEIWNEMGLQENDVKEVMVDVEARIIKVLRKMLDGERKTVSELAHDIQIRTKELSTLTKELGKLQEYEKLDQGNLINTRNFIDQKLDLLREEKERRMKDVRVAIRKNEKLCAKMKIDPMEISKEIIPSPGQFDALKCHNKELEEEFNRRSGIFLEIRSEILDLLDKLEIEPVTSFEKYACSIPEEGFILSSENLTMIEEFLDRLQESLKSRLSNAKSLGEKIELLNQKLKLPCCRDFLVENSGYSTSVIEKLQLKLNELEETKLLHIGEFILKIREELSEWWDKCHFGVAERNQFPAYNATDYTEPVLLAHESELEKIKLYYNENFTLFAMINEVKSLWAKRLELDRLSKDPTRLGNWKILQQEEKDRKRVNNGLPKMEARLFQAIDNYEAKNGQPFMFGGMPFKDYWEEQVIQHERDLEMEKRHKTTLKKQINIHETLYGTTTTMRSNVTKNIRGSKRPAEDNTPLRSSKVPKYGSIKSKIPLPQTPKTFLNQPTMRSNVMAKKEAPNTTSGPRQVLRDLNQTFIGVNNNQQKYVIGSIESICSEAFRCEAVSSTFMSEPGASKLEFSVSKNSAVRSNSVQQSTPFKENHKSLSTKTPSKHPTSVKKTIR